MARAKTPKFKEVVKLRFKDLAGGGKSLFLDYHVNGARRKEYLKMYLVPEKTPFDKATNAATLRAATAIKSERARQLVNGEADIRDTDCKIMLLDYTQHRADELRRKAKENGRGQQTAALNVERAAKHLARYIAEEYGKSDVRLSDVDKPFMENFGFYLRGGKLAKTTQRMYYNLIAATLNGAEKNGIIPRSPARQVNVRDIFGKKEASERAYLTAEELQRLIATPPKKTIHKDVTTAFLFSCFCGLRWSDIVTLKWGDVHTDGTGWRIEKRMVKTQELLYLPLSDAARQYMPERGSKTDTDNVFAMPCDIYTNRLLAKWVEAAGITKHITFHCARHTFATLMLTQGADLYTTSKLLGHSNIQTTQIYAKIIDQKKTEAVNLLNDILK